ncbi:MAG: deoxyuridine 5'-triphosphate nucleotidohydrolase [Candidatus Omnitrophica bacterium]|nr:deoxyuridine 5'-triphosphate nucleotidohydrolase [Candidatus Omnitrophota bacterium]
MLNKEQIKKLIREDGLITGYVDLDVQLTPNGFDLTAGEIFVWTEGGSLDFSNSERIVPQGQEIAPQKKDPQDRFGWWYLQKGVYKVRTNEKVNMPATLTALAFSRTSLLRMGAFTQNGVWDAGFKGKSEFILVVENEHGISLKENARLIQLIFLPIAETEQYNGIYQNFGDRNEQ